MEQKIIIVESSCTIPLNKAVDEKLSEMNSKGFRLISISTIPAKSGGEPDAHGNSYGTNEQKEMIFEKQ
jgi:hypothetical protein